MLLDVVFRKKSCVTKAVSCCKQKRAAHGREAIANEARRHTLSIPLAFSSTISQTRANCLASPSSLPCAHITAETIYCRLHIQHKSCAIYMAGPCLASKMVQRRRHGPAQHGKVIPGQPQEGKRISNATFREDMGATNIRAAQADPASQGDTAHDLPRHAPPT